MSRYVSLPPVDRNSLSEKLIQNYHVGLFRATAAIFEPLKIEPNAANYTHATLPTPTPTPTPTIKPRPRKRPLAPPKNNPRPKPIHPVCKDRPAAEKKTPRKKRKPICVSRSRPTTPFTTDVDYQQMKMMQQIQNVLQMSKR